MNLDLARKAAALCRLVYDGDPDVLATVLGTVPHVKSVGDLFCAAAAGDEQWIILRGTAGLSGWIMDLDADPVILPGFPGKIHHGFADAFTALEPWLDAVVTKYFTEGRQVNVTGHSLGGALATLISYWLQESGHAVAPVYTFGSPRVGDAEFAAAYWLPQVRVVNDLDPVPHVPAGAGYTHVGEEVRLPEGAAPAAFRDARALWRVWSNGFNATAAGAVKDHMIASYCDALAALAPVENAA